MIGIVQHVYCVNDWAEVAENQINRLIQSGLYEEADEIYATLNIKDGNNNYIDDEKKAKSLYSKYSKIKVSYHINYYEYSGIKKVWDLAQEKDMKILYFHAKGVSNKYRRHDKQEEISEKKISSIKSWVEVLEYFLIDAWKDCIEKLETYDNVGVTCYNGWFSGNFWWSQSKYIKTKTEPLCHVGRWYYEAWLNEGMISTNYEFYRFICNPYRCEISKKFYTGVYAGRRVQVLEAFYGSYDIQTDEGRLPNDEVREINVTDVVVDHYAKENTLSGIPVNNEYYKEDPHYGAYKQLRIIFKVEGFDDTHEIVFDEFMTTYFNFI